MKLYEYMAMVILFGGAIIMCVGGDTSLLQEGASTQTLGIIISFIISWIYSYTFVLTRKLSRVHWSVILFYTCAIGICVSSVWLIVEALYMNTIRHNGWETIGLLTLAGAVDIVAESFAIIAFQNESAGFVAMVG